MGITHKVGIEEYALSGEHGEGRAMGGNRERRGRRRKGVRREEKIGRKKNGARED
jgi:hypothetical protein